MSKLSSKQCSQVPSTWRIGAFLPKFQPSLSELKGDMVGTKLLCSPLWSLLCGGTQHRWILGASPSGKGGGLAGEPWNDVTPRCPPPGR